MKKSWSRIWAVFTFHSSVPQSGQLAPSYCSMYKYGFVCAKRFPYYFFIRLMGSDFSCVCILLRLFGSWDSLLSLILRIQGLRARTRILGIEMCLFLAWWLYLVLLYLSIGGISVLINKRFLVLVVLCGIVMTGDEVDLPDIGVEVILESGRRGVVYRHEYNIEGLAEDELHVMLLGEGGGYDEVLTCNVDELEILED